MVYVLVELSVPTKMSAPAASWQCWAQSEKQLGEGAFSIVFEGTYGPNSRCVAVKRVERARLSSDIEREAAAFKKLDHDNVLKLIAYEENDHFCHFILELCVATLGDFIRKTYRGEMPSRIDCLRQMARGLAYIHSEQLVHRDIKPDNVLVSDNPKICLKVSDFGLSKSVTESGSYSVSGMRGTVNYMAPEIVEVDEIDNMIRPRRKKSSDVFSLACVFYVFVTGVHPFGSGFVIPVNIKQNQCNLSLISRLPATYSLISKMLMPVPTKRPSMTTVTQQLDGDDIQFEISRIQ